MATRYSAACVLCRYIASGTREDVVMLALLEHVDAMHPDSPVRPALGAHLVDTTDEDPS